MSKFKINDIVMCTKKFVPHIYEYYPKLGQIYIVTYVDSQGWIGIKELTNISYNKSYFKKFNTKAAKILYGINANKI